MKINTKTMKTKKTETKCDVCGHHMKSKTDKGEMIGISFTFNEASFGDHSEIKRIERMFGKTKFNVCFPCCLSSLGIKRKNK